MLFSFPGKYIIVSVFIHRHGDFGDGNFHFGLWSGPSLEPPDLDRPDKQQQQQGLSEARLGWPRQVTDEPINREDLRDLILKSLFFARNKIDRQAAA